MRRFVALLVLVGCAKGKTPPTPTEMVTVGTAGDKITFQFGTEQACFDGDEAADGFCNFDKPPITYPVMTVEIDAFQLDEHEVTNLQYQHCVARGACSEPTAVNLTQTGPLRKYYNEDDDQFAGFPVVNVTWQQATEYCQFVGKRLPTEFEWEAAARGSTAEAPKRYPWGDELSDCEDKEVAISACNSGLSEPQLAKGSTANDTILIGNRELHGMAGNVSEWVSTPFVDDVTCSPEKTVFDCTNAYVKCAADEGSEFDDCAGDEKVEICEACLVEDWETTVKDDNPVVPECYAVCPLNTGNEGQSSRKWICERRSETFVPKPVSNSGGGVLAFRGGNFRTLNLCDARPWDRLSKSTGDAGYAEPTLGFRCAKDIE